MGRSDGSQLVVGLPLRRGAGAVLVTYRGIPGADGSVRDHPGEFLQQHSSRLRSVWPRARGRHTDRAATARNRGCRRAIGPATSRCARGAASRMKSAVLPFVERNAEPARTIVPRTRARSRWARTAPRPPQRRRAVVNRELEIEFANGPHADSSSDGGDLKATPCERFAL